MEKTPITKQTITPTMLQKLGINIGVDISNYDSNELTNGIIKELETMQTYTAQALTSEKLEKAFSTAFFNIEQNPSYYSNNLPLVVKQDPFNINSSFKEHKLSLKDIFLNEAREFKFNQFKRMDANEQGEYLKQFPKIRLGRGSSRYVVNVGNGKVIKFAMNQAGRLQNREEVKINKKSGQYGNLLPKIYDYDPKFQWVLSEIVKELRYNTANQVFKNKTGITFGNFRDFVVERGRSELAATNKFLQHVKGLIDNLGVGFGDLGVENHWGLTADGNLVLLDYGYANDVQDQYSNNRNVILAPDPAFEESKNYDSLKESFKLTSIYNKELLIEKKLLDIKAWKAMPPIKQVLFLKQNGTQIGEGSSRVVYLVNGRSVIKLARNEKGLAQNKAEVEAYKDPITGGLITKIFDYSADFRWLISELAKPFKDKEEFEKLTGFPFDYIASEFDQHLDGKTRNSFKSGDFVNTDEVSNPLIGKLIDLVQHKDFMHGDLEELSSWGKTADGRVVLLDYGFNQSVANKHYRPNNRPEIASNEKTVAPEEEYKTNSDDGDEPLVMKTNKFVKQK